MIVKKQWKRTIMAVLLSMSFMLSNAAAIEAAEVSDSKRQVSLNEDKIVFHIAAKSSNTEKKYNNFKKAMIKAIKKYETSVSLEKYGFTKDEYKDFYEKFLYENPAYFYVTFGTYSLDPVKGIIYTQNLGYSSSAKKEKSAYEKKVSSIIKKVDTSWSDFEKVLFINDYLTVNITYDTSYVASHATDVYGALVNGKAVCQGYSMAFMDLMDRLSVPCEFISSNALNHAWNLVKVNGKWYHVDVTFNDPVPDVAGGAGHKYLLKSAKSFASDGRHGASDCKVTGGKSIGDATSSKYDDYFWNDIGAPFTYYDGKWYAGVDQKTGKLDSYFYDSKKGGFVKGSTLITIDDKWKNWTQSYSYWVGCFSQSVIYKGKIYYSTPEEIHVYDIASNKDSIFHTDNNGVGYIYGLTLNGRKLTYYLKQEPNSEIVKIVTLNL